MGRAGLVVGRGGRLTGDLGGGGGVEVLELLGVVVGEVEEVGLC